MDVDAKKLRKTLRESGLSNRVIEAAWPDWWSDSANSSPSARAELCFAVARKLGLSPKSLFDERVEFVWRDHARFKHVTAESEAERGALGSFGVSIGRQLIAMSGAGVAWGGIAAGGLRRMILAHNAYADLQSLLSTCWGLGIPVIHLKVFPLPAKSMHAMVVKADGRYAVLLGKDGNYPAPIAFTLAHELGHVMLGHLAGGGSIVDLEEPGSAGPDADPEERAADEFALEILTGTKEPVIQPDTIRFGARALAEAVKEAGPRERIEPGTLAMCYAYQSGEWAKGMASLRSIYTEAKPVREEVNRIASGQLDWSAVSDDMGDYIKVVAGMGDA